MKKLLRFAFLLLVLDLAACSSIPKSNADEILVEGKVEVIGSMIEKAYMLRTSDRNHYLLNMSTEMAEAVNNEFPKPVIIKGELYLGEHVGRKQACIRVSEWRLAQ